MLTKRAIEEKISMLHSNASKYIESLEVYNSYKIFLDKLYGKYSNSDIFLASSKPQEDTND